MADGCCGNRCCPNACSLSIRDGSDNGRAHGDGGAQWVDGYRPYAAITCRCNGLRDKNQGLCLRHGPLNSYTGEKRYTGQPHGAAVMKERHGILVALAVVVYPITTVGVTVIHVVCGWPILSVMVRWVASWSPATMIFQAPESIAE